MKMTSLLNMTADEFFWRVFLGLVIFAAVMMAITAVCDKIAERNDRKREMERRACKRSGASIRPTRRY